MSENKLYLRPPVGGELPETMVSIGPNVFSIWFGASFWDAKGQFLLVNLCFLGSKLGEGVVDH